MGRKPRLHELFWAENTYVGLKNDALPLIFPSSNLLRYTRVSEDDEQHFRVVDSVQHHRHHMEMYCKSNEG